MGQIMMVGLWSRDGSTPPMEVRTTADWVVRQRLLTIPGVSQVIVMGGGRKQFQVQVNPEALIAYDVTLADVERALSESNQNSTGGLSDPWFDGISRPRRRAGEFRRRHRPDGGEIGQHAARSFAMLPP